MSKTCVHVLEKRLNNGLVAFEKHPLADPLRRDEAGALQCGQMRRHSGLRQPATRVDLAGAYAVIERQLLIGEVRLRIPQPRQNLAADGIGERLVDRVDVDGHQWGSVMNSGTGAKAARRLHRNRTNHISDICDIC